MPQIIPPAKWVFGGKTERKTLESSLETLTVTPPTSTAVVRVLPAAVVAPDAPSKQSTRHQETLPKRETTQNVKGRPPQRLNPIWWN